MKALCSKCKSLYNLADTRIPDEGLQYKCPRCGSIVFFKKALPRIQEKKSVSVSDDTGTNPIVNGAYAGALGGTGCAIPAVLMSMLGIGFMSLGMEFSGFSAAASVLMSFLRMLSLGVLIGITLAFIGAKTRTDIWSIRGGLIGALMGVLIGLFYGIFVSTTIGGILGALAIVGTVGGWIIQTTIITIVVILVRKYTFFSDEESSLSSDISGLQKAAVGILFCLMIFTIVMEAKGLLLAKSGYDEAKKEPIAEGFLVKDLEDIYNEEGDLLITGSIENMSEDDKTGWYLVAELFDEEGDVLRKARLINGEQLYSMNDHSILKERGQKIPRRDAFSRQEDMIIEPGSSVPFEVVFFDPPEEYQEYSVILKNLDLNTLQEFLTDSFSDLKEDMKNIEKKKKMDKEDMTGL